MLIIKSIEALPLEKKPALAQQNGTIIHQMVKEKSRLYHLRIILSKTLQDTTELSSFKTLANQSMLVSLESVFYKASRCWAKEDYSYDNNKPLLVQNKVAVIYPNSKWCWLTLWKDRKDHDFQRDYYGCFIRCP